jgi:hypothetical protein
VWHPKVVILSKDDVIYADAMADKEYSSRRIAEPREVPNCCDKNLQDIDER